MVVSREEIVSEIRKLTLASDGQPPGMRQFELATGIKKGSWRGRYWARWGDALVEAGFSPNTLNPKIAPEQILEQLQSYVSLLGRFPVQAEFSMRAREIKEFPSYDTFVANFGDMIGVAEALLTYARNRSDERVSKIVEERLSQVLPSSPAATKPAPTRENTRIGFVYLKYSPSLRLYKIGKAEDSDRRRHGLSLLLPENLQKRHEIKTDQPYLLEKYWHNRFRGKRKQGEWFQLSSDDIDAFKHRREFMFGEFFP